MKTDELASRKIRQFTNQNTARVRTRPANVSGEDATRISLEAARAVQSNKNTISEEEAGELALKIKRHLKFSAEAFGAKATLFNDIKQSRARELLS